MCKMNEVVEQGELSWLDFEHEVSEWGTSEVEQTEDEYASCDEENIMIFFLLMT